MIKLDIDYDDSVLKQAAQKWPAAAMSALNKTMDGLKSYASEEIRSVWNVKKSDLDPGLDVKRAASGRLYASLRAVGKRIGILAFDARQTASGVTYAMKRGARQTILHGFIAEMPSGHQGVFLRRSAARHRKKGSHWTELPIIERTGPSVPTMMGTRAMMEKFKAYVLENLPKNLKHEIDWRKGAGKLS